MGTVQLVISVLDANDNAPQFNQSVYKVQIPENTERGAFLVRVNATDLDEGTNCNISYSLTNFFPPDAKDMFEIEKNSGEIHLRSSLDFEDAAIYRMQVDAQDKGNPPLSGHGKVVVEVVD
ncbi:protocadherin alpha-6-like, partial [Phasianus colchicus]|uniref:protocadherin alpha-6-like n=1 Tax=Phasianus colchicus TaxID=9054 RepID=UPI00129E6756